MPQSSLQELPPRLPRAALGYLEQNHPWRLAELLRNGNLASVLVEKVYRHVETLELLRNQNPKASEEYVKELANAAVRGEPGLPGQGSAESGGGKAPAGVRDANDL